MALHFGRHAGVLSVIGLAITLVAGIGVTRLEFATGQDSYLNKNDRVYQDNVAYQDLFGGQAMVTLFTLDEGRDVVDLFTPANLASLRQVEEELRAVDGVYTVISPLTALQFTENMVLGDAGDVTRGPAALALLGAREREPDPAAQQVRLDDAGTTLARVEQIPADQRTIENPAWVEFLLYDNRGEIRKSLRPFFPDETHAQIVTRLVGNASIEEEGEASEQVIDITYGPDWENASVTTTGASVLLKELNDYLRGGFLTLGGVAVVLMLAILLLTFKVRWRLLPLAVVLVGVIWAFGLAGWIGIPLSIVTISGLPILLGIGIDFAVQLHSRVEEEVQLDRAPHPIQETTTNLGPPLVIATVAAAVSFLALLLAEVPMIRSFGVLLAMGIVIVVVADIVLSVAVLGNREYRSPTPPRDYTRDAVAA
ncbi:MAG TPA: MMPL family transporter, partial [Microthrixaceae bacterium]|nr:MMPL family transporter [Microthrixaceae bacterium]